MLFHDIKLKYFIDIFGSFNVNNFKIAFSFKSKKNSSIYLLLLVLMKLVLLAIWKMKSPQVCAAGGWDGDDEERHRVGFKVTSSRFQFKLEQTGAPLACITVEHGTLCEGHVAFRIYQDNCIGPNEWKKMYHYEFEAV